MSFLLEKPKTVVRIVLLGKIVGYVMDWTEFINAIACCSYPMHLAVPLRLALRAGSLDSNKISKSIDEHADLEDALGIAAV